MKLASRPSDQSALMSTRMFSDIDHTHPEVREDIFNWIKWLSTQVKLGGLRLDAVRHFSAKFLLDLVRYIAENIDSKWFFVGEYWRDNAEVLARYIEYMEHRISLVDVSLLSNFSRLSLQENADLRTVFEKSLVSLKPRNAVVSANISVEVLQLKLTCATDFCKQPRHCKFLVDIFFYANSRNSKRGEQLK